MSLPSTCEVGILLFDDVEVLDFAGPYEVFTAATRMHAREAAGPAPFHVRTIARDACKPTTVVYRSRR